jgi:RNA polymerase sigma-B factor
VTVDGGTPGSGLTQLPGAQVRRASATDEVRLVHHDEPDVHVLLRHLNELPAAHPDRDRLRQNAIESQLPLVHHLAQRFRGRGEPYDDLVQVGTIGLLHAVDRFDPARGSFVGYAVPTILGEIRRHFRDRAWAMRVPRRLQELGRRVGQTREELTQSLGRSPTVDELARALDVDADLVLEALDTAGGYATVPLPSYPEDVDAGLRFIDPDLERVEDRAVLAPLLASLPARERRILALRFAANLSQSQISAEVGISQMHVSRLLARSLATLRETLVEDSRVDGSRRSEACGST